MNQAYSAPARSSKAGKVVCFSYLYFLDVRPGIHTSISALSDEDLHQMIPDELVVPLRQRALSPNHPVLRGTAKIPTRPFRPRKACNSHYSAEMQCR
jgi:pyruvate-ferredoxin/flavodoxin oxidoreductase